MAEPWAQLVSTADLETDPVMLTKPLFTIGRAQGNDISFLGNKLVSGKHCVLERDAEGRNWIQDLSTNGTLLNRRRKIHKERVPLAHGDEIYIVYRKDHPEENKSFLFQDMEALKNETRSSQFEASSDTEIATSESDYRPMSGNENMENTPLEEKKSRESKRKQSMSTHPGVPASKRHCSGDRVDEGPTDSEKDSRPSQHADGGGGGAAINKKERNPNKEELREKNDEKEKKEESQESDDEIEQSLLCIICQEIFHNCVSLQPCMHSYCAGCYSDWMSKSNECPSCRSKVVRINKNHLVNNLVEAYINKHPKKKRDDEDIKELDSKNKITSDMLYPARSRDEDRGSSSGPSDEEEEPEINEIYSRRSIFDVPRVIFNTGFNPFPIRPPITRCRQCRPSNYGNTAGGLVPPAPVLNMDQGKTVGEKEGHDPGEGTSGGGDGAGVDPGAGPSDAASSGESLPDVKSTPALPPYVCSNIQTHMICNCCMQPMPDRRNENQVNPNSVPPTQCELCYKIYCHAYWGCNKAECLGCIGRLTDMNFGKPCLKHVLLDNAFESGIIENYLRTKSMTVKDMLKVCVRRMDAGAYSTLDQHRSTFTGETVVCYACGIRNFKELVYQFRRDIPRDQLPDEITSRTDCHWGKNCRTQRHNINHATRYNHICEQTATSGR